ncbi:MAG: type II secretion system F family protein, partial [Methylocapsa sp.]|nr:type II secretion system F family protein [Methylocapsa sp.]
ILSGEIKAEKRQAALISKMPMPGLARQADAAGRRKKIAESLADVDERTKKKKQTLEARIAQAGLSWSRNNYLAYSAGFAAVLGALFWLAGSHPIAAIAATAVGGLGAPAWLLKFLSRRRLKRFADEFPSAIDILVRGVRAGLPLGDCLRVAATETAEPVRSEFKLIMEAQAVGFSTAEAVERIAERVPIAEASFFSIVISIQQKSGGNLAETLSNLSSVLRDRKKMKAKVKAISSEAKSSAAIIGCLPILVAGMVYLTSPKYVEILWSTQVGQFVLAGCAVWMGLGVFVMKKMINFDI